MGQLDGGRGGGEWKLATIGAHNELVAAHNARVRVHYRPPISFRRWFEYGREQKASVLGWCNGTSKRFKMVPFLHIIKSFDLPLNTPPYPELFFKIC